MKKTITAESNVITATPTKEAFKKLSVVLHTVVDTYKKAYKSFFSAGVDMLQTYTEAYADTYKLGVFTELPKATQLVHLKAIKKTIRTEVCDNMGIISTPSFNNYCATWCRKLDYAMADTAPLHKHKKVVASKVTDGAGSVSISGATKSVSFEITDDTEKNIDVIENAISNLLSRTDTKYATLKGIANALRRNTLQNIANAIEAKAETVKAIQDSKVA